MFRLNRFTADYIMAGDPELPAIVLNGLSRSTKPAIRARIAENPSTPVGTLLRLLIDQEPDVRLSLSYNKNLPQMFLKTTGKRSRPRRAPWTR